MRRLLSSALAVLLVAAATVGAQAPGPRIWDGVYTAAQAARGKTAYEGACLRCHGGELGGTTAPALKGERFMASWGGEPVSRLFEKIRDTMPPNVGTTLDTAAKIDIVSYILQVNGFPPGSRDLSGGSELSAIAILRQGEQPKVQNFALVQAVGCLTRTPENRWMLRNASEPVATTADTPTPDALTAAESTALGPGSVVLLSAAPFDPAAHIGRKVEARGLIYQEPGEALMTVTSLRAVGPCP
jgi:hypothetical protein